MRPIFVILCTISACLLLNSCTRSIKSHIPDGSLSISVRPAAQQDTKGTGRVQWHPADKKIIVLFGYGFNTEPFIQDMLDKLESQYGTAKNNGLIVPLIFPDDFKHSGRERISLLTDYLEGLSIGGIILLGAPENTHAVISKLMAAYDKALPFPVFSLFPQDDVLGTEYISDFILDAVHSSKITDETNLDDEHIITKDISSLLISAINYLRLDGQPLKYDVFLGDYVQLFAKSVGIIHRYVDTETGIQAGNHFILE